MPADPAWQHLDAPDAPVLSGLIRRKLAEVRTAGGSAATGRPGVQLVHGGYDGSSWPRRDGLKWPHLPAVAAAGMVVSA